MKKFLLIFLTILLMVFGLLILAKGEISGGKTANFKNLKTTFNRFLAKIEGRPIISKELVKTKSADALLLLVSDNNENTIFIQAWKNIAAEEGLHLDVMTDSDFLNLPGTNYVGIILPDTIHKDISSELSKKLIGYVSSGGALMLVYDAATQNENNSYSERYPLMAALLGIGCGKETIRQGCSSATSPIGNTKKALASLGVPPGKCIIAANADPANNSNSSESFCAISSSEYGILNYVHFIIRPIEDAPSLLTTEDNDLIATIKSFGSGRVLFINLPLTYLWAQTDAMFLHLFIHYFASNLLQLPTLAAVPNGVGGLVMNLHVESIDALVGFDILKKLGLFLQGPYSIDFTAGPGLNTVNDHRGLDVLNNKVTQGWMRYLLQLGNAIGSDGGWLHNYFGLYASETNQPEFQNLIKINNEAIEKVLGQKVLEYVPCDGNQPSWATRYLEQQGFLGYYSTSNTGTAPTQNFRHGIFDKDQLWSFPVSPLENGACFRDFGRIKLPAQIVTDWLVESTQFVSSEHTSRLIYFHPTDILYYPQYLSSLKTWLALAQQLHNSGTFQWYTMVDLARFLDTRRKVVWNVENNNNLQFFTATHPRSLNNQSWLLNKDTCEKPKIIRGQAIIKEDNSYWIVQAGDGQRLEFTCQKIVR